VNTADDSDAENPQTRSFRVRQASSSDLPAIRALLEATGLPTADLADMQIPWFLVAAAPQGIIGSAAVEPCGGFGLLRSLSVHATARGQGVARSLVEAVEAQARSEDLRGLYLLTNIGETFFARLGYMELERWELPESIRRTRAYRELCPQTARAMMKRLS
jgi:amino-acid N-acetyltransferase